MTASLPDHQTQPVDVHAQAAAQHPLAPIEQRVRWLSAAIVHHANRVRENPTGLKVGGHQASCASMTTIMTSLYFKHLRAQDRVSVKPHASPVLHAINYLQGTLGPEYLPRLREYGGLQSYPSRTKDPDPVDYSTGSVGIGATAPVWGALARRYVEGHLGGAGTGRQYSLLGDAELDEGACWEAILDPMVAGLGEVVWIVDLNRQSLDRVAPAIGTPRLEGMFAAAGWQVITVKYGSLLHELSERPGGALLLDRISAMTNPEYQRLLRCEADELRRRLPDSDDLRHLVAGLADDELLAAVRNLGGHDLHALDAAFEQIDDTRPTVILAYTIKGHGLASEGHPQNHSQLLTDDQMGQLAARSGMRLDDPFRHFPEGSPEALICDDAADRLRRESTPTLPALDVPADLGRTPKGTATTQAALGRALLDVARAAPAVGERIVTLSPDVSSSTNLGGWINKTGVWALQERDDWFADDAATNLRWHEHPGGQHVELGIAEVNLVGALGEFGATWSRWGQPLIPVGVLYDPFVERALEPWSFGIYAGGQSILVGTPSGVSLAGEGGAHQSVKTPSIGLEQPGCISYEPAFALEVEWCLLAAMAQIGRPGGSSAYLRLSTRPVDQALAAVPEDAALRERRRRQVCAGGYLLRQAPGDPEVTLVTMGAVVTETLQAADRLAAQGVAADVLVVTSPDLLWRALQARRGQGDGGSWILDAVLPAHRAAPMVTVLDGHPHALAFLAGVHQVRARHLGVSTFGQCGDLPSLYRLHGIDADAVVAAAHDLHA